ncbi:hypothetical protein [Aquimarina litoralis]|uniref:hypothetical protein n=1 Tax=Aquimarina litoralis TaxID=584605 RepID=UPI001C563FF1|nr:hypothetical protein [Aquimarina litoralis]MBW1294233.1 hypothetical protein [Aquimarina litoralis]
MMNRLVTLCTILLLTMNYTLGQENLNEEYKLKVKSITAGFGVYTSDLRDSEDSFRFDQAGSTFSAGLSLVYKKHLFSLDIDLGLDVLDLFGNDDGENASFNSYDILYGREFSIFKWLRIEAHTGLGLYLYKDRLVADNRYDTKAVIGIPVDIRFMIDSSRGFSFGINPELNFNEINTTYIGNIVFQYRFN